MTQVDFLALDPRKPATVENVVAALTALRRFDETEVAELASAGDLRKLFPFQPLTAANLPPDFEDLGAIPEASPGILSEGAYSQLLRASLPPSNVRPVAIRPFRNWGSINAQSDQSDVLLAELAKRDRRYVAAFILTFVVQIGLTVYTVGPTVSPAAEWVRVAELIAEAVASGGILLFASALFFRTSRQIRDVVQSEMLRRGEEVASIVEHQKSR